MKMGIIQRIKSFFGTVEKDMANPHTPAEMAELKEKLAKAAPPKKRRPTKKNTRKKR